MSLLALTGLLLLGSTAGVWAFVFRWSRQPERHVSAWTICWNIGGVTLLLLVFLVTASVQWILHYLTPSDYAPFLYNNPVVCLLPLGLMLGVPGLICFGVAYRPGGKFTSWELGAAALLLLGLLMTCTGSTLMLASQFLQPDERVDIVWNRLLPGLVFMLIAAGLWYSQVFQARAKD